MAGARSGGRKRGALGVVTPPLRSRLKELMRSPDVSYDDIKRKTGLSRSQFQRLARGKGGATSSLAELHRLVGLPPPDRSLDSRLQDAFTTVLELEPAHAEALVVELERQATELRDAAREEGEAGAVRERAQRKRREATARPLPTRAVH